ncbi:hypothetical protein [Roseateles aquatilis]|nr:hypothetical protein [Roseateles aquatilis]
MSEHAVSTRDGHGLGGASTKAFPLPEDGPAITKEDISAFEIGNVAPTFTDFLKAGPPADPS